MKRAQPSLYDGSVDIKNLRRHLERRLDYIISSLQDIKEDIESYDDGDDWLVSSLETASESLTQLFNEADAGSLSEFFAGGVSDDGADTAFGSDEDEDDDDSDVELDDGDLDFSDADASFDDDV